jgi:hypothetical protein
MTRRQRQEQEKRDLENLVAIIEMHESTGETYDPSTEGFVFSEAQINEVIQTHNRELLIEEAYDHRVDSIAA